MNNDKELLELAAKAAGMRNYAYFGANMHEEAVHGVPHCGGIGPAWNPLTDDGDALRLAVKLGIDILPGKGAEAWTRAISLTACADEPPSADREAATRLAIVRAAAAIGSSYNAGNNALPKAVDVD